MTCRILFSLTLFSWGCADLELIAADVCGNHVVEPQAHEECDGSIGCGAPESAAACRLTCQGGATCPEGYGCGIDQVCRKPSGSFEVLTQAGLEFNRDIAVRDADGDGRADVLRLGAERGFLEFYGDGGAWEMATTIGQVPPGVPSPVITDLDADGLEDVLLNVKGVSLFVSALAVYRLQSDRSFENTVYASLDIPGSSMRAARAQVLAPSFDDEMLSFVDGQLVGVDHNVDPEPIAHGTSHTADAIDGMVAARFDESSPCDLLAVVDGDSTSVSIINPCVVEQTPRNTEFVRWRGSADPPDVSIVTLPGPVHDFVELDVYAKALRQALLVTDWNTDGHLDLVAVPHPDMVAQLFVAYGQGDGTFHSQATPPVADPDGAAGTVDLLADYPAMGADCAGPRGPGPGMSPSALAVVMAVSDFDDDGGLDIVREDGIYLRGGALGTETCGQGWLSVQVDDFDGNGTVDVAASRMANNGIEYLGGAGDGSFAQTTINTPGLVMQLVAGDYDGDLVNDVAFFEHIITNEAIETSLGVAFGRGLGGAPEQPVSVGRIPGIKHLAAARLMRGDSTSDLAVLAQDEGGQALALVSGDSGRELSAPFLLNLPIAGEPEPVAQSVDIVLEAQLGAGRGPLVVIGRDDFKVPGFRLNRPWVLDASDDAQLNASISTSFDELEEGMYCEGVVYDVIGSCPTAAVDLDADGIDELIVFGATNTDSTIGVVHTLVLGEAGFDIASTVEIGNLRVEANDMVYNPNRPVVADFDGDGYRDIVVEAIDTMSYATVLLAFFSDGAGALSAPSVFRSDEQIQGVGVAELDGDPQAELAVGLSVTLEFFQVTDRQIVPVEQPVELSGAPPDPWHIANGDVDGDGVQDLVVAGFYRHALLRGIPVEP